MSETIHVLLIEDHAMVRAGFRMLLEAQPDMAIVGEAERGRDALALLDGALLPARPDVILMDVSISEMEETEVCRLIKARFPEVRILALAVDETQAQLVQMLDAGADGYLPKRAAADELVRAVRAVYRGERYVHPSLGGPLPSSTPAPPEEKPPSRRLTPRQRQVLRLVAEGLTSQKVGEALGLSSRTVDRHVENMLRRLKLHSRVELVLYAIRQGLVDVGDRPH
jgi:two-component system response regulator NreC